MLNLMVMMVVMTMRVDKPVSRLVQFLAERVMLAILIVVTHLGVVAGDANELEGLLSDLRVTAGSVTRVAGTVDGVLVNLDGLSVDRLRARVRGVDRVDGRLLVVGLGTSTVTTLDSVDGRGNVRVRRLGGLGVVVVMVDVDVSLGVLRLGPAVLDELVVGTGTVVMLLFTSDADLFLAVFLLSPGREASSVRERRGVMTFPSGFRERDG
jgi:hypothetical protein